jgi:hypothetical protein
MATWILAQGSGDSWTVPILDASGNAITYTGLETLSGDIWPGGTRASLVTLTPTWLDPAAGTTTVSITGTNTTSLSVATYIVRATVDDGNGPKTYYRGSLKILASPGSSAAPATYISDDDLRDYAPWIDALQADSDQTGFGTQCGKARSWLDEILITRWKYISFAPQLGTPGWGTWSLYGGRDPMPSKWLRDQLAANLLMVRDLTKEVVAKRALYYICKAQLGRNGDHAYQDLARGFAFEANELVKTYRAEIDLNGDGYADVYINCGASNLR